MATMVENTFTTAPQQAPVFPRRPKAAGGPAGVLLPWLRAQSINVSRHAAALRPFKAEEFGSGAEAPTPGHLQAVNQLISGLRSGLLKMTAKASSSVKQAIEEPTTERLQDVVSK